MANTPPGQQLNDLLVTRNFEPQALDASGKPAAAPVQATTFSFDYRAESGKDYGTVVVMLGEDNVMNVFFGDNVGKSMEGDDKKEWFDFLYQLRQFAKRNLLTFSLQNLNKLKYSMQGQAAIREGIFESWSGKRDVSYNADATQARLMIKHKRNIGEGEARYRNIDKLFIETADGERFRLPFTSLSAGRAMLEHVRQGGTPYDHRGQHIATIVTEMNLLSRFRRANAGKIFEGETAQLVEQATEHYTNLHHTLKSLSSRTGYKKYFESWNPAAINDEDVIIEDLRHMFIEQNIDSRIEQALPLLARLKQETAMKEINVFEGWMNLLSEGTWALPDTAEKQQKLIALMADELPVGPDASNATELLYDLLGDDDLFDQLSALAKEDANADARTIIINKLEQMKSNPAVAQVIGKLKIESTPQAAAPTEAPPVTETTLCETCMEAVCECNTMESLDEQIQRISELSGSTLKSYIKKAGSSSDERSASNLSSRAAYKLATAHQGAPGDDDGNWDDEKSYLRSKGIARAVDRLEERDEERKFDDKDQPVQDSGWKKSQNKDPRGIVTHLSDVARRAAEKNKGNLKELSPNTLGSYVKKASSDRAIRNFDQGFDTGKSFDQREPDFDADNARRDDSRRKGIRRAVNRLVREDDSNPVESAIINRIMRAHPDVLQKYGPEAVMTAARDQAEWVGDVDEIGSSDVSAYVAAVVRDLESNQVNEISDKTVERYKDKAWDEFARGNDRRGAGIGRALDKQRGAPGHVKTTGQDDQLDELSPGTLKNYIKKASNSAVNRGAELGQKMAAADEVDRYTNRHFPKGTDQYGQRDAMRKAVGADYDDINRARSKAQKRVSGIGRATDRLAEGGMTEVDLTLQEIARGNVDIYDIYTSPKSNVEKFVSDQLHQKAEEVAREQGYNLDDDIDDILQRIQRELEAEYGVDDNMDIEMETAGGGNWLEETTALTGQYGHSGKLEAVKPQDADMMDRIKFLAGISK